MSCASVLKLINVSGTRVRVQKLSKCTRESNYFKIQPDKLDDIIHGMTVVIVVFLM